MFILIYPLKAFFWKPFHQMTIISAIIPKVVENLDLGHTISIDVFNI